MRSDIFGTGATELLTLDIATGAATVVGTTGQQIPDITITPSGVLRGWSEIDSTLNTFDNPVEINTATGATSLTASGLSTSSTGVAVLDETNLYVMTNDVLYSVNVTTGVSLPLSGGLIQTIFSKICPAAIGS